MNVVIDFANLSLKDALDLAILIEEEAQERYQEFVQVLGARYTGDASDFFAEMVKNEAKHAAALMQRRKELFGDTPRSVSAEMIWDVEAPSQDRPRAFMSTRQALLISKESEQKAHAFFDAALKHVKDPAVKELFVELREEEAEHEQMVDALLAKVRGDDEPDQGDEDGDPPPQL